MRRLWLLLFLLLPAAAHATVSTTNFSTSYVCSGNVGPFPFVWPISDPTAMSVTQNGTLLPSTAWTSVPVNNNYENGGTITLVAACPTGQTLVLTRNTPILQLSVFADNMPNPMTAFMYALDKLTEIAQEQATSVGPLKAAVNGAVCPEGQTLQSVIGPICQAVGIQYLNGLQGQVTIAAGSNTSVTTSGQTITISASGGGGGGGFPFTNGGTFTNTQLNQPFVINTNNTNLGALWHIQGANNYPTEGLTVGITSPVGGTNYNTNGIGVYMENSSSVSANVGFYDVCKMDTGSSGGNNACWLGNGVAFDTPGYPTYLYGYEADINANNVGDHLFGFNVAGAASVAVPQSYAYNVDGLGPNIPWNFGFFSNDGAATYHYLGSLVSQVNAYSQYLCFGSYSSGGAQYQSCIQGSPTGQLVLSPGLSGAPVVVPQLLVSGISASTSPVCPNGPSGAFTTSGCTGGGGGSGTVSTGNGGYYSIYPTTGTTVQGDATMDNGQTTAGAVTVSNANFQVSNPSTPSEISLTPNTNAPTVVSGAASLAAPPTVSTAGTYLLPAAPGSGVVSASNSSGMVTLSIGPGNTLNCYSPGTMGTSASSPYALGACGGSAGNFTTGLSSGNPGVLFPLGANIQGMYALCTTKGTNSGDALFVYTRASGSSTWTQSAMTVVYGSGQTNSTMYSDTTPLTVAAGTQLAVAAVSTSASSALANCAVTLTY